LVPALEETAFLDRGTADKPSTSPYIEVAFGAQGWFDSPTRGWLLAVRLALVGADGATMLARRWALRPGRPHGPLVRQWWFEVDESAWRALVAELRERVVLPDTFVRAPDAYVYVVPCAQRWTIFDNCHDFTLAMLAVVGLKLRPPLGWTSARSLAARLDEAVVELERRSVSVLGLASERAPARVDARDRSLVAPSSRPAHEEQPARLR